MPLEIPYQALHDKAEDHHRLEVYRFLPKDIVDILTQKFLAIPDIASLRNTCHELRLDTEEMWTLDQMELQLMALVTILSREKHHYSLVEQQYLGQIRENSLICFAISTSIALTIALILYFFRDTLLISCEYVEGDCYDFLTISMTLALIAVICCGISASCKACCPSSSCGQLTRAASNYLDMQNTYARHIKNVSSLFKEARNKRFNSEPIDEAFNNRVATTLAIFRS